jgi:hypothetical protein
MTENADCVSPSGDEGAASVPDVKLERTQKIRSILTLTQPCSVARSCMTPS